MNEKIFIPINGCNEKNILQTVLSAINNAQYPNRLFFAIFEQSLDNKYTDFSKVNAKIVHVKVDFGSPLGVGLPRIFSSVLNDRKQDFLLQIDAHMIFEKNWDTDLIKYYSIISQKYNKPIISTYVPWWYEDDFGKTKLSHDASYLVDTNNFNGINDIFISKLIFDEYKPNLYKKYLTVTGSSVDWSNNKNYEEHYGISGHFLFSSFDFIENVSHDPFIPWGGDEAVLALRAWTRGYRIFSIPKAIVWHKNKWGISVNGIGIKSLDKNDWRIHTNYKKEKHINLHNDNINYGYKKMKDIFLGDYLGFWGAPNQDLLKEFEFVVGKNFNEYYDLLKEYLQKQNDFNTIEIMYE
jgi:hypothetical protein